MLLFSDALSASSFPGGQLLSPVPANVREHYSDDAGEMKPGRKGIALTKEQWSQLCDSAAAIDALVDEMSA